MDLRFNPLREAQRMGVRIARGGWAMRFIYLGHYREDIYTLLAKEEAMHALTKEAKAPLLFTGEVSRAAITIAEYEDINDIHVRQCLSDRIDFTRRLGGGSVIWLDHQMLLYFLTVPVEPASYSDFMKFQFHQAWGRKIALAIKNMGAKNVYVGERFSIALGKSPRHVISGNTVMLKRGYFSYHGVLVLDALPVEAIKKYVVLRKTQKIDEGEILSYLPSLSAVLGKGIEPEDAAQKIVEALSDHNFTTASQDELAYLGMESRRLREKYVSRSWIFEPARITKTNAGFCLIAFSESWDEKNFYAV